MADRDDDGDIDINDIEIVDADLDDDGVDDMSIDSLFNPDTGLVSINISAVNAVLTPFEGFGIEVRYATSGQELTRSAAAYVESVPVPATDLLDGETLIVNLTTEILDGAVKEDIAINAGTITGDSVDTLANTATFVATGAMAAGDGVEIDYVGQEEITVPAGAVADATGDFSEFTITSLLNELISGAFADVVVVDGPGGGPTGDVIATSFAGTGDISFTPTVDLIEGDTFTVEYLGRQTLTAASGLTDGEAFTLTLPIDSLPLQDTDGDGTINSGDLTLSVTGRSDFNRPELTSIVVGGLSIATLGDPVNGLASGDTIALVHSGDSPGDDLAIGTPIFVSYDGLADLVTVQGTNRDPIDLRLRETEPDSGVFEATFIAVAFVEGADDVPGDNLSPNSGARPEISVLNLDAISITYDDPSVPSGVSSEVDISVQAEEDPPEFNNTTPETGDTVNDLNTILSTDVFDSIAGVDEVTGDSVNIIVEMSSPPGTAFVPIADATDDLVVTDLGSGVFRIEYDISNITDISDAIGDGSDITATIQWEVTVLDNAGNLGTSEMQVLNVDNRSPVVSSVIADSRTTIRVTFDREMSDATGNVLPSDFLVDGVEPLDAELDPDDSTTVILTVPELAPDATPSVDLVGSVADLGGNTITSGTFVADDGIAPDIEATLASDLTDGDISVSVTTDETIVGLPTRVVMLCVEDPTLVCTADQAGTFSTATTIVGESAWDFDLSGFGVGAYEFESEGSDAEGNTGSSGILPFEIDDDLALPTSDVDGMDDLPEANPFVMEVDWAAEGDEYPGDTHDEVVLTKAVLNEGEDNERDVLGEASTRDSVNYSLAVLELEPGDYTLTVNGADDGGNELGNDMVFEFTIVEAPPFELNLTAGINMVSLPGEPADGNINTLFGGVEEIVTIFTRDANNVALVAFRDPADPTKFIGNLTEIDATRGYGIETTGQVPVEVLIPALSATKIPPTISVDGDDWSFVPVISLLPIGDDVGEMMEGSTVDADAYLGGAWDIAWSFVLGRWESVSPGGVVEIGRGYWVFFTSDTNINPAILFECDIQSPSLGDLDADLDIDDDDIADCIAAL